MSRHKEAAHALLEAVEENSDGEYQVGALVGIGYALLALYDLFEKALKDAGD